MSAGTLFFSGLVWGPLSSSLFFCLTQKGTMTAPCHFCLGSLELCGSRTGFLSEPHRPTTYSLLPTAVSRRFSVVTMQVRFALETSCVPLLRQDALCRCLSALVGEKQLRSYGSAEKGRLFDSLGRGTPSSAPQSQRAFDDFMSVVQSPRNLTDLSKPVLSTEVRHSEVPFLSLSLSKRGSLLLYPEPSSRLILGDEEQAPGAKKRYTGWGWGNPRVSSLRLLTLPQRAHLLQNRTHHFKLLVMSISQGFQSKVPHLVA